MIAKTNKKASPLGSSFDKFLRDDGLYEEATLGATKRVLAEQLRRAMNRQHLTKTEMARRMHTSRSALERLIDPANENVTLQTLDKAARAIGRRLTVVLT
ncbi:MAG: helix-turn-helix transcriptional regulator [Phycisphaerae bacterium]